MQRIIVNLQTGSTTTVDLTAEEIAALPPPEPTPAEVEAQLASAARAQRNLLLQQSDWTQVADAPVDQAAWATYRQALRDITAQAGFPKTVNWPEKP